MARPVAWIQRLTALRASRFRKLSFRGKHNRTHPCLPVLPVKVARPQRAFAPRQATRAQARTVQREPRARPRESTARPPRSPPAAPSRCEYKSRPPAASMPKAACSICSCTRAKLRDVLGAAQKLDVRVAADDAGRRTGRIDEDAIKRTPIPEGCGDGACRPRHRRVAREPPGGFAHPLGARGIDIDGYELGEVRDELQNMAASCPPAPRRRRVPACPVGHPGGVPQAERRRPAPRSRPCENPGSAATADGCSSRTAAGAQSRALGSDCGERKLLQILRDAGACEIHAAEPSAVAHCPRRASLRSSSGQALRELSGEPGRMRGAPRSSPHRPLRGVSRARQRSVAAPRSPGPPHGERPAAAPPRPPGAP